MSTLSEWHRATPTVLAVGAVNVPRNPKNLGKSPQNPNSRVMHMHHLERKRLRILLICDSDDTRNFDGFVEK